MPASARASAPGPQQMHGSPYATALAECAALGVPSPASG